jgi:diguanylate cyclase (GGDEF)-like protein
VKRSLAERVSVSASAARHRTTGPSSQPRSKDVALLAHVFDQIQTELSRMRARLTEAFADRASLFAQIEFLEDNIKTVQKFAYHDELTGLPNRRLLEDRYGLAVARSDRQRDNVALLFIDIDGFKKINDAFGHSVADRILQLFADRLVGCIRASDTACRYGGDEFVVLLSDSNGRADAVATATKIRERLRAVFVADSQTLDISVSIGIALYPIDGPELGSLIRAADSDMYRGKGDRDGAMANDAFTNEGAPPGAMQ